MKRVLMIVTVLMATWLLQSVQAEGHMYSIEELNRMGQSEWKETYQANGRTVEVDCTVDIPDVSSFPVLTVQVMPPVEEPLYSALLLRYAAPKGTRLDYEFRSNDYQTVLFGINRWTILINMIPASSVWINPVYGRVFSAGSTQT